MVSACRMRSGAGRTWPASRPLVLDASNDRLRSSGHAFGDELRAAGSTVREVVVTGRHGFLGTPRRRSFRTGMATIADWLGG